MQDNEIYALISRVLSGEANRTEQQQLTQWLEEAEENQAIYNSLQQIWQDTKNTSTFSNADRVYRKFLQKRDHLPARRAMTSPGTAHWLKAGVAAVLLLIGAASYWWLQSSYLSSDSLGATAEVVKENPAGQKSKIVLSDGTIVWLNSESILHYPASFGDSVRRIALLGEAYFQVAKDSLRPFVVESGGLQTTAIGTAFNVRHYAEDSVAVIFLEEGEVMIESLQLPGTFVYLEPGWGVSAVVGSSHLEKFADRSAKWAGWRDGILYFDNASLNEVMETCERWYSVEFSINGLPPKNWKFTGKFTNENLANVLESMRYGKNFDFTIKDKQVQLNFNSESL